MDSVLKQIQKAVLNFTGLFALVIAAWASTWCTFIFTHQPECPKELLK